MDYRYAVVFGILIVLLTSPLSLMGQGPVKSPQIQSGENSQFLPPQLTPPNPDQNVPPPSQKLEVPPIKNISPGVFDVGGVRIVKKENRIEFPAQVNMNKGLLEYLIVGPGGKVHESLLRTSIEPYSLQVSLLMLGLEGTTNPLQGQGDPRSPQGDPVTIWIIVKKGDTSKKMRIEDWVVLKNNEGKTRPMKHTDFIFTGSTFYNGIFMAQMEKSIVAVYHDPVALIDNPLPEGGLNPYQSQSNEMWSVNQKDILPIGTDVMVSIEAKKIKGKKGKKP